MGRFLVKFGLFLAIQALIVAAVLATHRTDLTSFTAATRDKHARLDRLPSPRLILCGGSNLAFGADSPALERALGLPVVNMAMNGRLGLDFLLREALDTVRRGDVLVLSIEYLTFNDPDLTNELVLQVIEQRPASARYLSWEVLPALLDEALYRRFCLVVRGEIMDLRGVVRRPKWPYVRSVFNAHGDVTANRGPAPVKDISTKSVLGEGFRLDERRLARAIRRTNAILASCRGRGATVYFAYSPVPRLQREREGPTIERIGRALEQSLTIPFLYSIDDVVYPLDHFYDTAAHLNGQGLEKRTRLLIDSLRPRLEGPGPARGTIPRAPAGPSRHRRPRTDDPDLV